MAKKTTSSPIGVKPLSPDKVAAKYADRKRVGKTEKDRRKNGPA